MSYSTKFVTAFAAVGFLAAAGAASACEWHKQHVTAKAAPPASEEQADVAATPIDPVTLAGIDTRDETEASVQK